MVMRYFEHSYILDEVSISSVIVVCSEAGGTCYSRESGAVTNPVID